MSSSDRKSRQLNRYNLQSGLKSAMRIGQTVSVLSEVGINWLRGDRKPAPRLLRETFEKLGTTYIKLGQFIASSPSVFPKEYVEEFQRCLDQTTEIPFSYVKHVVESELGRPLADVYSFVDPVPLASASIAQVHAARLVTGEDVVIKVQKAGVERTIMTDFNFIYAVSRVFEIVSPGFSRAAISGVVDEIQKGMLEECDFLMEADNLVKFDQFLETSGNDRAVVPKPYMQATTEKVLTMERLYGVPLTDLESIRQHCDDPSETLITALNTWFASLMMCDFFHADVHAGNLMVLDDGRIGFIDFGIVGRIGKDTWKALVGFFEGMTTQDFELMAESMLTIGMTDENVDTSDLAADISVLYERVNTVDPSVVLNEDENNSEVNAIMMDLVSIGEDHGIRFPREFALLIKQFLYFDRYVQILAPEMNMFDDARLDVMPEFAMLEQELKDIIDGEVDSKTIH